MSKKPAASSIVLVGPSHPYTGGIAQHTTRLALELEQRGYDVVVESWKAQYPRFLRPGQSTVPDDVPEIGLPKNLVSTLDWRSPLSWVVSGLRSRKASHVALSIPTPYHLLPYSFFLAALGKGPKRIAIVHNMVPHEAGPLDHFLMGKLLGLFDTVVAHGDNQALLGRDLTGERTEVKNLSLPSPWADEGIQKKEVPSDFAFLFFGTIRQYKGLDILLRALSEVENCKLLICGEFWEEEGKYLELIEDLRISDRVEIRSGYVATSDFPQTFCQADVLVLPYRTGTGSFMTDLGFRHGLPVIASNAGSISSGIRHDENGLIFAAESTSELVKALRVASSVEKILAWRRNLQSEKTRQLRLWDRYCAIFD